MVASRRQSQRANLLSGRLHDFIEIFLPCPKINQCPQWHQFFSVGVLARFTSIPRVVTNAPTKKILNSKF